MNLRKTYSLTTPPEAAMPWKAYEALVVTEWSQLLDSNPNEAQLQTYLERHPCLLPWVEGEFGGGHHGAFPAAVITQPKLAGIGDRYPDFLWIVRDSLSVYAVLVEIESPRKHWFTRAGQPHNQLTQAVDQLREWRAWFSNPANLIGFMERFQVPWAFAARSFQQRYVLIYGRRNDPSLNPRTSPKRRFQAHADEIFMSYDRLAPNANLDRYLTVRLDDSGYRAVNVPPTLQLGPFYAEFWSKIRDKDLAVASSPHLSNARRAFLIERWPYWDRWAQLPDKGPRSLGDWE